MPLVITIFGGISLAALVIIFDVHSAQTKCVDVIMEANRQISPANHPYKNNQAIESVLHGCADAKAKGDFYGKALQLK